VPVIAHDFALDTAPETACARDSTPDGLCPRQHTAGAREDAIVELGELAPQRLDEYVALLWQLNLNLDDLTTLRTRQHLDGWSHDNFSRRSAYENTSTVSG